MGVNMIKDLLFDRYLPGVYRRACRKDIVKGRVLFVEYRGSGIPDNFRLLIARLQKEPGIDCRFIALDRNHSSYPAFIAKSTRLVKEMARAEAVFLCEINEVVSCVKKREGTKVVQLWHACGAFKKFGYSAAGIEHGTDRQWLDRHPVYGNLDLVTVSSPAVIDPYAEAMHLEDRKEIIKSIGVSRSDIYFQKNFPVRARQKLEDVFPAAKGKKVILYAPTVRGRTPFVTSAPGFDAERLIAAMGEDYVLVIKHHPFVQKTAKLPEGDYKKAVFEPGEDMRIEQLLCASDMVITDYSSLIFEYSLLERPMFFFAADLEEYEKWNGFYEPYEEMVPGRVCRTMKELEEALLSADRDFDPERVRRFRKKYMSSCDGHATERIINEVFHSGLTE